MSQPIVKRSPSGLGLFASKPYQKDDLIIEYTGETISADEANRRGGKYLFELNDNWTIDGKDRKNTARYVNHACRPNAYAELNEDETRIHFYAKKKIAIGDEITCHYGKDYFERILKQLGCRCTHCTNSQ